MIQQLTFLGKKVTVIHNSDNGNVLITTFLNAGLSAIFKSQHNDYFMFAACKNPVGILLFIKPYSRKVTIEEAVKEFKKDLDAPDTVYSGLDYFLSHGDHIHPRVYYKKLLEELKL